MISVYWKSLSNFFFTTVGCFRLENVGTKACIWRVYDRGTFIGKINPSVYFLCYVLGSFPLNLTPSGLIDSVNHYLVRLLLSVNGLIQVSINVILSNSFLALPLLF